MQCQAYAWQCNAMLAAHAWHCIGAILKDKKKNTNREHLCVQHFNQSSRTGHQLDVRAPASI